MDPSQRNHSISPPRIAPNPCTYIGPPQDYICNWVGNQKWVRAMQWPGHAAFNAAPVLNWTPKHAAAPAGTFQATGNLTYVAVWLVAAGARCWCLGMGSWREGALVGPMFGNSLGDRGCTATKKLRIVT
jgi:hypothetical protein